MKTSSYDYQHPFLEMMEILSEYRDWHSYLREAMDIWLPLHHRGPTCVLHILCNVGGLLLPGSNGYDTEKPLWEVVKEEWMSVPGPGGPKELADRLGPLVEVTKQVKRRSFSESERQSVLAAVEQADLSLKNRQDYGGELRKMIKGLLGILREPAQASSHQ